MAKKNLLESAGLPLIGLSVFLIVTTAVWLANNDSTYEEKQPDQSVTPEAKVNTCCEDEDKLSVLMEHRRLGTLNESCCPLFMEDGSNEVKNPFSKDFWNSHEQPKDETTSQVTTETAVPVTGLLECTPEELENKSLRDMCSNTIVWVVSCLFKRLLKWLF